MAKRTSPYRIEKRRKELNRQKKKEEKRQRRLSKTAEGPDDTEDTPTDDVDGETQRSANEG